jgi:hypothetical protein
MDLLKIKQQLFSASELAPPSCDIRVTSGEVVLYGNRAALLHLASRIVDLVLKGDTGIVGSHFTIDKADLASEAETAITIAYRSETR